MKPVSVGILAVVMCLWASSVMAMPKGAVARLGKGCVNQVAFSPDSDFLAVASSFGIYLYDPITREQIHFFETSSWVSSIAFSPGGDLLASGSSDKTIKLWDLPNRLELATLTGHTGTVRSVAFSPDGRLLASGSYDDTIRLWDISSQKEIVTLKGHSDSIYSVAFSPDGQLLASGSSDKTIKLWDVATHKQVVTLMGHQSRVESVAFSPDSNLLASGGEVLMLWDVASQKRLATMTGHSYFISCVIFSPDGSLIASGSGDETAKLWDVATLERVATLTGHKDDVVSIAFSPDGKLLATGSATVWLWDIPNKQRIAGLKGHTSSFHSVDFSVDGGLLASGNRDNTINLWDVSMQKEVATLSGHNGYVYSVAFSPDGNLLASGSYDHTVKLWDVSSQREAATLREHTSSVYSVAFSRDGALLASGSGDTIRIRDVSTLKEVGTIKSYSVGGFSSIAFNQDGRLLAGGSSDWTVKIWPIPIQWELATLRHKASVDCVAFSPDGSLLASGSYDRTIIFWDASSWKAVATLTGHISGIESITFSPDGRLLASGSWDNTIRIWDVPSHRELVTLSGHKDGVASVAFSPDGKLLASGSWDGTILIWDIANMPLFSSPPVVSNIPDQTIEEGEEFTSIKLDDYVSDPDNSDAEIVWTYSGNSDLSVRISDDRIATITIPDPGWTGSETIAFTATDPDGLSSGDSAAFTVEAIVLLGDVNDDSAIRSNDAILALRVAAGLIEPTEYQKQAADMNGDGKVNSADAILILRKAADLAAPVRDFMASSGGQITVTLVGGHGVAGESVTVSLNVDNAAELAGGDICIFYDNTVLRAVDVSFGSNMLTEKNMSEPGVIRIAFVGLGRLGSKTLARIEFDILADDLSLLELSTVELYQLDASPIDLRKISAEFGSWAMPPKHTVLLQNFPNPFNPDTWMPYQLKEANEVIIQIFSVSGKLIRELRLGYRPAGLYVTRDRAAYWDGRNESGEQVASGVYFYTIQASEFTATRKMVVAR